MKFVSLLAATALTLSMFAGCSLTGDKGDDTIKTSSVISTASADSSKDAAPSKYTVGARTDKEFSSKFLGFNYKLPDGFAMSTDEEIKEMMDIGAEVVESATDIEIDYNSMSNVYEMVATSEYGDNVSIMTEKIPASYNETSYWESLSSQLKTMYADAVISETVETTTVAGMEFKAGTMNLTVSGVSMEQIYLFRNYNGRMCVIIITSVSEGARDSMLAGFTPYAEIG